MQTMFQNIIRFCLLYFLISNISAQSCQGGSFYNNESPVPMYNIEEGYWYLNVEMPCDCSGEIETYTAEYYELQLSGESHKVRAAVWTPIEGEEGSYEIVSKTTKELMTNKHGPLAAGSKSGNAPNNKYARKGAVIGVYFESNKILLPIIGQFTSPSDHSVCKLQGSLTETTTINCTSNMFPNLIIKAQMEIDIIACVQADISPLTNGNYTLLDGDIEYGARIQYYCNPGYLISAENDILRCNDNSEWEGNTPTCTLVVCDTIDTVENGTVDGSIYTYDSVLTFTCNDGYQLAGNSFIVCTSQGTWSNPTPLCNAIASSTIKGSNTFTHQTTSSVSVTPSISSNSKETQGNDSAVGIAVGVVVVLIVLSIAVIVVITILIVLKFKNQKLLHSALVNSDVGLNNQTYQSDVINTDRKKGIHGNLSNPIYEESKASNPEPMLYESVLEMDLSSVKDSHGYFQLEPFSASLSIPSPVNGIYESFSMESQNDQNQYAQLEELRSEIFSEEPIYWQPETNAVKIYQQLAIKKYREIPREKIKITDHLGSGQFGTVDKGEWSTPKGVVEVAIKTLKGLATEEEEMKFLQEAAINGQFHHPNVVQLCGVVTVGQPIHIVLEYIPYSDLKAFLEKQRPVPGELADDLLSETLINFSHQIACGMVYLSNKHFIHRDLAARNILIGYDNVCKIADFGMSRDLQDEAYYSSNSKRIPVKWTAPEAINYRKYSTQSDIWSFGAVLFEIWSVGYKPFHIHTNAECIRLVDSGYCLPSPPGCPRSIYELMIMCWNPDPSSRPPFDYLQSKLSKTESLILESEQLKANLGTIVQWDNSLYPDLQNRYK